MATALIALGSNLGDRQRKLDDAVAQLGNTPNVVVLATSRWRETKPVGGPEGQAAFLNGAALLGTSLTPQQLHAVLQQIETAAGRTREGRWAPRTLDLDLLLYDDQVIDTPELTVPHPRMAFRRFVLERAAEIGPDMRHPTIGWTIEKLTDHVTCAENRYFAAIAGPILAGKTELARMVAEAIKGRVLADALPFGFEEPNSAGRRRFDRLLNGLFSRTTAIRESFKAIHFITLSDFWLDQEACAAQIELYPEQIAKYLKWLDVIRLDPLNPKPKLVVVLDVPADVSWQRIAERGDPNPPRIDWLARYRELLLKRVAEPGHGPVLRLDGTKPEEAKDELIAAIQAMQ
jgi:2-amino-4-hydroxy-6-hydroxymethyldihydropteridine diphosphokinase